MAMVGVAYGSLQADSRPKSTGLVWGLAPSGAKPHSSGEPSELSQWLSHDDSTINIILCIIIIIVYPSMTGIAYHGFQPYPCHSHIPAQATAGQLTACRLAAGHMPVLQPTRSTAAATVLPNAARLQWACPVGALHCTRVTFVVRWRWHMMVKFFVVDASLMKTAADSLLPIVQSQRERFRVRAQELETVRFYTLWPSVWVVRLDPRCFLATWHERRLNKHFLALYFFVLSAWLGASSLC